MTIPAPFTSSVMEVEPQWIDFNGHMNMAYYSVLFDRCADEAYGLMGLGIDYIKTRGNSTFTAEFHICYVRELHLGSKVRVTFRLIDHDEKRFHTYQEIWHEDGWLAATAESMALHIDMTGPRVCPMPADVQDKMAVLKAAHDVLPRPERLGRSIGIPRKTG